VLPKVTAAQKMSAVPNDSNEVDAILARLDQKSREIKTYETKIVYQFKQPLLESESLREGMLYYINDEKGSKLRINFTSLRQDDAVVPNYREEYLFDGVHLTRVDYKLKNVEYRQLTDANKPLNAFELASDYLPIVGFARVDRLKDDFEISHSAARENDELLLTAKPQSRYKSDYAHIRFWIDKQLSLPVRMEATSPQEDISVIRLGDAKMNKELPKDIFTIDVPANFDKNTVPLENKKH
jgi:outer membrane lipoprotein-sorting protein